MFEQTAEGKAIAAEMAKRRKGKGSKAHVVQGSKPAEQLSGEAATAGLDASRDMREDRDGHAFDGDEATEKRSLGQGVEPGDGGTLMPGPISPEQYQRPRLAVGQAAYSHQSGPARQPGAAVIQSGDGPIANSVLSGGGRRMQRPAPRPGDAGQ